MPQDVEFFMPYAAHVSDDVDGTRIRTTEWARRHALITSPADEKRIAAWDMAGLMGRWIPQATGFDLDLTVREMVLAPMFDDQLDSTQGRDPDLAERACRHFAMLTGPDSTTIPRGPLALAYKDSWRHLYKGASVDWAERAAEHRRWFFDGSLSEVRNRHHRRTPSLAQFIAQRRKTGYVEPMFDLSQKARHFELPASAYEHPVMRRLRELANAHICIVNDVHSLEKEEERGQERDNIVHVLMSQTRCDREASIARVVRMADKLVREFAELAKRRDGDPLTRRFIDCLCCAMSGYLYWSRRTERYARPLPVTETAYSDVLHVGTPEPVEATL